MTINCGLIFIIYMDQGEKFMITFDIERRYYKKVHYTSDKRWNLKWLININDMKNKHKYYYLGSNVNYYTEITYKRTRLTDFKWKGTAIPGEFAST